MPTFAETEKGYANMWASATLRADRAADAERIARQIIARKIEYSAVEKATGVPWLLVGCLHYRESNCNFRTHLHNGDPLSEYTVHVPRGRPKVGHPPPFEWQESAVDALLMRKLDAIKEWTLPRVLFESEEYNGEGYERFHNENSPYVWAGTNHQQPGKYTSDGKYDPQAWDTQLGVAAILKAVLLIDEKALQQEEKPVTETVQPTTPVAPAPPARVPAQDPIPNLIAALEKAQGLVKFAAPFIPPPYNLVVPAIIPALEEILQVVEDLQQGKGGVEVLQVFGSHFEQIGKKLQEVHAEVQKARSAVSPADVHQQPTG